MKYNLNYHQLILVGRISQTTKFLKSIQKAKFEIYYPLNLKSISFLGNEKYHLIFWHLYKNTYKIYAFSNETGFMKMSESKKFKLENNFKIL